MTARVRKAVIPAAGRGTRFLPASKAIPKEMLPVVDRPAIQYVVEEAVRAGLDDVLFVTSAGKAAMEDHFDRAVELEDALRASGSKQDLLAEVEHATRLARVHAVRQGEPLGLGHAVLQARGHVGDDPFAVLLGDDFVGLTDTLLERMTEVHLRDGRPVVGVMEVPEDQVHLYGVIAGSATDEDDVYEVTSLVEKPDPAQAPSNLAIIGRYVLPGSAFDVLEHTAPGKGGEIQLTDALNTMATDEPIRAVVHRGTRHDTGDKLGYLKATVQIAAEREDLGGPFLDWLRDFVASTDQA